MADWSGVTREHVLAAIAKFDRENPDFPEARSTFLRYNEHNYPAKHIRGMAYEQANGTAISKQDFTGGMETVKFFTKRGFNVYYKGSLISAIPVNEPVGTATPAVTRVVNKEPVGNPVSTTPTPTPVFSASKKPDLKKETPAIRPEAKKEPAAEAIRIPNKGVIEQKNALQLLLNKLFAGDVVCEKTFDWMKTPQFIDGPYQAVYDALHQYRGDAAFAKKNVALRCDFVIESQKLIIEYDERQHFSEARGLSLSAYNLNDSRSHERPGIRSANDMTVRKARPRGQEA